MKNNIIWLGCHLFVNMKKKKKKKKEWDITNLGYRLFVINMKIKVI